MTNMASVYMTFSFVWGMEMDSVLRIYFAIIWDNYIIEWSY